AHVASRPVGEQQVEDDRVGWAKRRRRERIGGGRRGVDLVPSAAQVRRQRAQELRLVVDHEDALLHDVIAVTTCFTGKDRRTRVPPRSRATLSSVTPFACANPRAITRPRPRPGSRDAPPWSSTSTCTSELSPWASTSTVPTEYLSALSMTLKSTRW